MVQEVETGETGVGHRHWEKSIMNTGLSLAARSLTERSDALLLIASIDHTGRR